MKIIRFLLSGHIMLMAKTTISGMGQIILACQSVRLNHNCVVLSIEKLPRE